jgi:hypothetical protein
VYAAAGLAGANAVINELSIATTRTANGMVRRLDRARLVVMVFSCQHMSSISRPVLTVGPIAEEMLKEGWNTWPTRLLRVDVRFLLPCTAPTAHSRLIQKAKAIVAVQHTIITIVWNIAHTGELYNDLGADYYSHLPDWTKTRAIRQLEAMATR